MTYVESTPIEEKRKIKIPNQNTNSSELYSDLPITIVYATKGAEEGKAIGIKFSGKSVLCAADLRFVAENFSQILGYGFTQDITTPIENK
jgi:hypothetical protein